MASVPVQAGSIAPVEGVAVTPSPARAALLSTTRDAPHFAQACDEGPSHTID